MITGDCVSGAGALVDLTEFLPGYISKWFPHTQKGGGTLPAKDPANQGNIAITATQSGRGSSNAHLDFVKFLQRNTSAMLEKISPDCDYSTWISIGAALKLEGFSFETFDAWSSHGSLYNTDRNGKDQDGRKIAKSHWESFRRTGGGSVADGRKIVQQAMGAGWMHPLGALAIPDYYLGYSDRSVPRWLEQIPKQNRDGSTTYTHKVNESLFCLILQTQKDLYRLNGHFYNSSGTPIEEDAIRAGIQKLLRPYFHEGLARKTRDLFMALENECFTPVVAPSERKIYCADGITLSITENAITPSWDPVFTPNRLTVKYNPIAVCTNFEKYISDLFYDDDIPVVQEFLGYCLIPSTRAQAAMFIKGDGGEGKSVLTSIIKMIWGATASTEKLASIENDRFALANMENKLINVDDDLQTEKLDSTDKIKTLVTARVPLPIERKGIQKKDAVLYTRLLCIGNVFIGSKFDHSDGFYRRQLLVNVKPKTRKKDDAFMIDKIENELPGVLNWCLIGLTRLLSNGYHFTTSQRMQDLIDGAKKEDDNTIEFAEDRGWIIPDPEGKTRASDLWFLYCLWCEHNAEDPIKKRTFGLRIRPRLTAIHGVQYPKSGVNFKTRSGSEKAKGYTGIRLSDNAKAELMAAMTNKDTRIRLDRYR